MIHNIKQMQVSLEQMKLLINGLEDLKDNLLPEDPELYSSMAEGSIDQIDKIRREMHDFISTLPSETIKPNNNPPSDGSTPAPCRIPPDSMPSTDSLSSGAESV